MEQQVVVKAHSGENIVVNISADVVMTIFGFHPGDVVRFSVLYWLEICPH